MPSSELRDIDSTTLFLTVYTPLSWQLVFVAQPICKRSVIAGIRRLRSRDTEWSRSVHRRRNQYVASRTRIVDSRRVVGYWTCSNSRRQIFITTRLRARAPTVANERSSERTQGWCPSAITTTTSCRRRRMRRSYCLAADWRSADDAVGELQTSSSHWRRQLLNTGTRDFQQSNS